MRNSNCPVCGSHDVHIRRECGEYHCSACGHWWRLASAASPIAGVTPLRIFLSYGHDKHAQDAQLIKADLERRGHSVWFDLQQLKPGRDWELYIEQGLRWCDKVVLLMTPHSVRRRNPRDPTSRDGYCLNEIAKAIERNKLIIPVLLVELADGPPTSICRIQYLDLRDVVPLNENRERYEARFPLLMRAIEHDDLDFEGGQTRLIRLLQPIDFSTDMSGHIARFTGREWLMAELDQWLQSASGSRVFWLTGGPGLGKTAFATYLCHTRRDVIAFHLCVYGHSDKSSPERVVRSIAYQMAQHLPEYYRHLQNLHMEREVFKDIGTLFPNLISQPLSHDIPEPDSPRLVVIDAIDEASRGGRNKIAELIRDHWTTTPPWLRLLVTSRPDAEVVSTLAALEPHRLDGQRPENLDDVRDYARRELLRCGLQADEDTIGEILRRSEGAFLYVIAVIGELEKKRLSLDHLDEFPIGLSAYYQRLIERQFPDAEDFQNRHRALLELLAGVREPLPVEVARQALGWSEYDCHLNTRGEASGEAITPFGSLITVTDGRIRPFHRSVMDWLTDGTRAGRYHISEHEGHRRLAEVCLQDFQGGQPSNYTVAHLHEHLFTLNRWVDLLALVASPKAKLIDRWVERGQGEQGLQYLKALIEHVGIHPLGTAALATQVGRIHSLRGECDEAREWLEYALTRSSWLRGRRVREIALHELGNLYVTENEKDLAARVYRQALRLCVCGWPVYQDEAAVNYIGLATVARMDYRYKRVLRLARKALRKARAAGHVPHAVAAERTMALALDELGQHEEAVAKARSALEVSREAGIIVETARLLRFLACSQYDQATLEGGSYGDANRGFCAALDAAERAQDFSSRLNALLGLGWLALAQGEPDRAETMFQQLIQPAEKAANWDVFVGASLGSACITHERGDLLRGGAQYGEVLSFAEEQGFLGFAATALVGIGATEWHSGNQAEAERTWTRARVTARRASPRRAAVSEANIRRCTKAANAAPRC